MISRPSVLVTSEDEVGNGVHEFLAAAAANTNNTEEGPPTRDFASVAMQCASSTRGLDALLGEAAAAK